MLQPNDSDDFLHKKSRKLLAHTVSLVVTYFTKCIAYVKYLPDKNVASLNFSSAI